jgi:hypothetical protein
MPTSACSNKSGHGQQDGPQNRIGCPLYVTVETHGTEGQVLKFEDKVKEVKEDIVVAIGLSRSLVTGDGPNFATASVSMQKMMVHDPGD